MPLKKKEPKKLAPILKLKNKLFDLNLLKQNPIQIKNNKINSSIFKKDIKMENDMIFLKKLKKVATTFDVVKKLTYQIVSDLETVFEDCSWIKELIKFINNESINFEKFNDSNYLDKLDKYWKNVLFFKSGVNSSGNRIFKIKNITCKEILFERTDDHEILF